MKIKAAGTIRLSLSDQVLYHVIDVDSPNEIWAKLETQFLDKTAPNKLYLKQELYGLKMQEGTDLTEHVNTFNRVISDLARIEVKVEDEDRAILMLTSLPKSYKGLVVTLTYGKTSITASEVTTTLLSYDQREKKTEDSTSTGAANGQAFFVKNNNGGKSKKKKPQCFHCKEWGHIRRFCPTWKKANESANIVVASGEDSEILVLESELFDEVWLLDSGSSFHVTSNKEWFSSYKSGDFGVVYQADGTPQHIIGMGDIKIKTEAGDEVMLQDVRYMPRARRNLISLGELHGKGYLYYGDRDNSIMKVKANKKLVMKGKRTSNNLYKVHVCIVQGGAGKRQDAETCMVEAAESKESGAGSCK
jgi:hypothetical protein